MPRKLKTYVAYDTETSGLYVHRGHEMFAYSTCDWRGATDVRRLDGTPSRRASSRDALERLWADRSIAKVCHNARFDLAMTEAKLGRRLDGHEVHETMALSHIYCNLHQTHSLDDLAFEIFGYPKRDKEVKPYMSSERGLADCPEYVLDQYQRHDATRTMLLFRHWHPRVEADGYGEIYDMERRLVWTKLRTKQRGMMLDQARCREMSEWCRRKADDACREYQAMAGVRSTPGSVNDLRRVLFTKFGLPSVKRTPTGLESTDKEVMEELRGKHPVVDLVFKWRAYHTGAAIIAGYLDWADDDGVLHPGVHPYGTRTGRESCREPNLQNVSKETTLRSAYPIPARRCFRPRPGMVNFHLDYSSIEARLLTHFSQDENLMRLYTEGDGDFHSAFARVLYGERWRRAGKAERKSLRDAAKNGDFGLAYGAGTAKFLITVGLKPTDRAAYERVVEAFPAYCAMSRQFSDAVRERGYVENIFGRRLSLARNKPYVGMNYAGQGSAAGVLKRAQPRVEDILDDETGGEAGIVLPIHDELIVEWPRARLGDAPAVLRKVVAAMVRFPQVSVPLEVDVSVSTRDWATLREYDIAA